jgi:hypothetical protein
MRRPDSELTVEGAFETNMRNRRKFNAALRNSSSQRLGIGDAPDSGVRWIRSYALAEESGEVGTFCVYEAESPEAIRKHAEDADLPCDEIIKIADTVIVRPDPVAATS